MNEKEQLAEVGEEWVHTKMELKQLTKEASNLRKKLKTLEAALLTHMQQNNMSTIVVNDKKVYISMKLTSDD